MAPQLACHAHGVQVPDDDSTVNAAGGEVVALSIEAHTCRVAGADGVGYVFGVVLEQVVVGEKEVHLGSGRGVFGGFWRSVVETRRRDAGHTAAAGIGSVGKLKVG